MFDFKAWSNDPGEAIFPLNFFGNGLIMSFVNISSVTSVSTLVLSMTDSVLTARAAGTQTTATPAVTPGDPYYVYIGLYGPDGNRIAQTDNVVDLIDHTGFVYLPLTETVTLVPGIYRLVMIFSLPYVMTESFTDIVNQTIAGAPVVKVLTPGLYVPAWSLYLSVSTSSVYATVSPPMSGIGELYPERPLPPGAVLPPDLSYVEIFIPEPYFWCALA